MSNNHETSNPDEQLEAPVDEQSEQSPSDTNQSDESPNREAAKYRRKLREAEENIETLSERLKTSQQALVNKMLSSPIEVDHPSGKGKTRVQLIRAEDLFSLGAKTLEDFATPDGDIDTESLAEAVGELHSQRPELFAPQRQLPNPRVSQTPPPLGVPVSWQDALKPKPKSLS